MKKILIAIIILLQIVGFVLSWPSFYYYPRSGNSPVVLSSSGSLSNTGFEPNSATVFIVHGYTSSASNPAFQLMKSAFNLYTNVNVILVDWAAGAAGPPSGEISIDQYYMAAVSNLKPLAQNISAFISVNNIDPNGVVCIGHSLGAHGCGMAGKAYYSQKGKKFGRISGLDPAGPLFVNLTTNKLVGAKKRLDDSDATYVDCILTSPFLGIVKPICRANFYPNQLNGQPQCAANDYSCQHSAAIGYYIASIPGATNCKFISKRCASYQSQCSMCSAVNPNKCIQMGWFASSYQSANGTFVLSTKANQPYCVN